MTLPVHALFGRPMSAPEMRGVNAIQLLNLIQERGPVSRADLAKRSGLSKPTVSEQVGRLIELGLARETGPGVAGEAGGKRPTLVGFDADAGRVAGVDIGAETTRVAIADLDGRITRDARLDTEAEQGPRRLRQRVERTLGTLLAREPAAVRAIGVGVPGRVDCRAGVVLEAGSVLGWDSVALRGPLEQRFGCPVQVDNDVNVALVAELHRGAAREAQSAVLIRADLGVGAAVAIGRRVHHGAHWAAGEIAHLAAESPAPQRVSPRGQLESVLGVDRIERRVRTTARRSAALRKALRTSAELPALFAAATGDAAAGELAAEIAQHAAVAVASQALAFDPEVILLSGELFGHVLPDIQAFLSRTVPWSPPVQLAGCGEDGVLMGAVDTALLAAYEVMARQLAADAAPARTAVAGA